MPGRHTTPRSRSTGRRRRGSSRGPRRPGRPGKLRLIAGLAACVAVVGAAILLYLYVGVTSRFEGRLWKLPSRVYSDRLVIYPGAALEARDLAERLDRCGYARSAGRPERPGQYRRWAQGLQIFVRPFEGESVPPPERPVHVLLAERGVESIRTEDGRNLSLLELEPELLATLFGPRQEERQVVALDDVPPGFIDAVLAAEDSRFYEHGGVDARAVLRAAFANLRRGRIVQGGSTITQQTVKNLFLGPERTWWRKAREAVMSVMLDLRYSKDRILEVYLNEVYLGQRGPVAICGAEAASRFYFGRSLVDLSLGEWALVAGMIRSPGSYNPFTEPDRARARRDRVLDAMLRLEYVESRAAERAKTEKLRLASGGGGFASAAYAVDFVRAQLEELYPPRVLLEDGLTIYTTVDTTLQQGAERALGNGLARLERDWPSVSRQAEQRQLQGAVVVLEPHTGAVLAMVGGREYRDSQFNRAVQARRQPGSCFKPFVYVAGFEKTLLGEPDGLTPASALDDSPLERVSGGQPWAPANYDGEFRGTVIAARALTDSLNVPTVRAAETVGLERVVDAARRAGIESPMAAVPSLALGTMEVTPLELATAYGTLVQQGSRVVPQVIREVRDRDNRRIERRQIVSTPSIDARAAFLVTHVLQGVLDHGTARSARQLGFHGLAAGKTGTTDETRDAWFVGYTPNLLALVWVGYDDNSRTGLTGTSGALPIWVDLMRRAGRADSRLRFAEPPGLVRVRVDPASGGLAVAGCPERLELFVAAGTEPTRACSLHRPGVKQWFRKLLGKRKRRPRTI